MTVEVPAGNGPTEVPIPIVDDEIKENFEQYFVGVLDISGNFTGAQIGANNTILLIIEDDESKCTRFCLRETQGGIKFHLWMDGFVKILNSIILFPVPMFLYVHLDVFSI